MTDQLTVIALIVKSENIISGFVQDLRIIQLLCDSQFAFHNISQVQEILNNLAE